MTTEFNLISDLHLEVEPVELPGGKTLILSGDVMEAQNVNKHIGLRFFEQCAEKYEQVLYVPGNHEYYGSVFEEVLEWLPQHLPSNVQFLHRNHAIVDDVLVLGVTLWTDCRKEDPLVMHVLRQNMNDFQIIGKKDKDGEGPFVFTPFDSVELFKADLAYLKQMVEQHSDKKIVVCSHHAPSDMSIHPKYMSDQTYRLMNGGFASNLEEFILDNPQIVGWSHGHTHTSFDYRIGSCRVMCNPKGYGNENPEFNIGFTFEV